MPVLVSKVITQLAFAKGFFVAYQLEKLIFLRPRDWDYRSGFHSDCIVAFIEPLDMIEIDQVRVVCAEE